MSHRKSTDHTEYSLVIGSGRVPFEKCAPVLDKLIRFRVFKYVLLKSAHACHKISKFCLGWFWLVIEGCHVRSLSSSLANAKADSHQTGANAE